MSTSASNRVTITELASAGTDKVISFINDYVLQANQTNLAFLRERAAGLGYAFGASWETISSLLSNISQGLTLVVIWRKTSSSGPREST